MITVAFGLPDLDQNADGKIVRFARKHKLSLGVSVAQMLVKLKALLENPSPDRLDIGKAFFFCYVLFHSNSRTLNAILYSFRGLKEHKDWYDLREEFSKSTDGFGAELNLAKPTFVETWRNPAINAVQDVAYHCELRLTDHLTANNIQGGVIGVSKLCCETCSLVLERRNGAWRTSGAYFQRYMNRMPSDSSFLGYLKMRTNNYLRNAIADLRRATELLLHIPKKLSRVEAQARDDDDDVAEDKEFDSWW
ncbi:hypothetical protein FN846DRAFT_1003919 [Sphaerosporella brunnea]|uniref:Uncharacterized protein n=1 Tax=Sphaerosporella brunnea TaxID=1250544 RepID=A0A5J5EFF4_9PEZI|nr:hypothetical protein FN846DRAFT_1003919 [Sphaerosporella brunnea]